MIVGKKQGANEPDIKEGSVYSGWTKIEGTDTYEVHGLTRWGNSPFSITPAQCRAELRKLGLRDKVQQIIEQDEAMLDWWEYALEIRRNNEYVEQMRIQLGWTEERLDEFFEQASKIE